MFDKVEDKVLNDIRKKIEHNASDLDKVVNDIISPYCKDLDNYVSFVRDCLHDGEVPPTTQELEDWCLNLSTYIYFASGMTESLGIRDDIAKAVYKEMYNNTRDSIDKGTVADKNSLAELASQEEAIISAAYTRSYKIMKAKVENAQELLGSCKKVLSHRITEEEMTNFNGGR